jgi:hypothetical protein
MKRNFTVLTISQKRQKRNPIANDIDIGRWVWCWLEQKSIETFILVLSMVLAFFFTETDILYRSEMKIKNQF